jgi:hypothetical protein
MAVAPLVIALEGDADLLGVVQARDRYFNIVPLPSVAHFCVMLEKISRVPNSFANEPEARFPSCDKIPP